MLVAGLLDADMPIGAEAFSNGTKSAIAAGYSETSIHQPEISVKKSFPTQKNQKKPNPSIIRPYHIP